MPALEPIRTPWKHRWRRFRHGTLPVCCFLLSALLVARLWTQQTQFPHAVGEVEAVRVSLTAGTDGLLNPLPRGSWNMFDQVEADQVVARLDDREVRARLATAQEELSRLRQEMKAETAKLTIDEAERGRNHMAEGARLAWNLEQSRLSVMDRKVEIELARLELQRCEERLESMKSLYARKMLSDLEWANEQSLRNIAARRIEEGNKTLVAAETQRQEAEARWKAYPAFQASEASKLVAPFAAAVDVQQSLIREIDAEIERLVIRAPFSGTICTIYRWPGESIRAGDPILTIAADHGRYIVGYVRQDQRMQPVAGMAVDIRARAAGSARLASVVDRVGPQVELMPPHLYRDPKVLEWGLPIRVAIPSGLAARPGELVDLRLRPDGSQQE